MKAMKIVFTGTNLLLWDNNDESVWLDELLFNKEDQIKFINGFELPVEVDYIHYVNGNMDGRVGINGVDYSFDLEGIWDEDNLPNFDEYPLFYLVD
jgi:hypothetical protein